MTPTQIGPVALAENIGVCVLSHASGQVKFQNPLCKSICGPQEGAACSRKGFRFCANVGDPSSVFDGMRFSTCERLNLGEFFDVALIGSATDEVILLYPLRERLRKQEAELQSMGLTAKELAICNRILRRYSNAKIREELGITENTLRTHLKSIYRKATPAGRTALLRAREDEEHSSQRGTR